MQKPQDKSRFFLITYVIILIFALYRISDIFNILSKILNILSPFLIGAGLAFILSIPLNFLERKFPRLKRPVSLLLTFLIFIVVITVLMFLVVPKLAETFTSIIDSVPHALDNLQNFINSQNINWEWVQQKLTESKLDWQSLSNQALSIIKGSFGNFFSSTFGVLSSVVQGILSIAISFIFAAYILISKEKLSIQFKKLMYAFLPEKIVDRAIEIGKLTHKTFSSFFTFQLLECVILGFMFLISMTILDIPYALLISIIIAVFALVPIFGLCIAFILASLFIVMVNPIKVIVFAILFAILQQIEGNLIYPKVVGKSIGLPPIWVILVITIGANVMGILGIILFIPLSSVIYTLLTSAVKNRIEKKKISNSKFV